MHRFEFGEARKPEMNKVDVMGRVRGEKLDGVCR